MYHPPPKKNSKELNKKLLQFFQTHSPNIFSIRLRCMLLDNMENELTIGVPLHMSEFLYSLNDFFNLLDTATAEFATPKDQTENEKSRKRRKQN